MIFEILRGIFIPFIGTTLGACCVFVMKKQINEKWFREMYGSGETHKAKKSWAYAKLEMFASEIAKQRPAITLPAPELIDSAMEEIAEEILNSQEAKEDSAPSPFV